MSVLTYTFNAGGQVETYVWDTNADGTIDGRTTYIYDAAHRIVGLRRDSGEIRRISYGPGTVLVERFEADGTPQSRNCERYHLGNLVVRERESTDGMVEDYVYYYYDDRWRRERMVARSYEVVWHWEDELPVRAEFLSNFGNGTYYRTFDERGHLVLDGTDWDPQDGEYDVLFSYNYDGSGRIVEYMEENKSHVENHEFFEYDSRGRLVSRSNAAATGSDLLRYSYSCPLD